MCSRSQLLFSIFLLMLLTCVHQSLHSQQLYQTVLNSASVARGVVGAGANVLKRVLRPHSKLLVQPAIVWMEESTQLLWLVELACDICIYCSRGWLIKEFSQSRWSLLPGVTWALGRNSLGKIRSLPAFNYNCETNCHQATSPWVLEIHE